MDWQRREHKDKKNGHIPAVVASAWNKNSEIFTHKKTLVLGGAIGNVYQFLAWVRPIVIFEMT